MTSAPVLLLHGWGGSFQSTFAANGWVAALSECGRNILAVDLPGHGAKASSHDPADYKDLTRSLAQMLPMGRADIIGYSLGGKIALALATLFPEKVARLIIGGVGDNVFAPETAGAAVADILEGQSRGDVPPQVRALADYGLANGNDPLALAAVLRRSPNPVLDEKSLRAIRNPIFIVNGARDLIAQPDQKLVGSLEQPGHILLPGVDHLALPGAAAFRSAAIEFLEQDNVIHEDAIHRAAL